MIILQKLKPQLSPSVRNPKRCARIMKGSWKTWGHTIQMVRTIWNQFLTRTCPGFPSVTHQSYSSPNIGCSSSFFSGHWATWKRMRKKKGGMSKYSPLFCIFIRRYLSWIGQITSGSALGRDVIGSQPGVRAVWPRSKDNKSNKLKSRQILPPADNVREARK